ncbi:uncharacterized protein LOC114520811 [Dendronephthya gigantea]|uniref:uncharacterized protein LOC114520811 n=1 Tax=Dendronephthya gigantea TaxID=151771 RepID=UPI00106BF626|nr:uncharacterized protein LOC114520811 [Dendronephthya gigantea]
MSALGDNKITVKHAESTDLSSLLNVLAWLKDAVFAPDRRVDLNLVKQLRSQVRNPWAHAPDQKLPVEVLNDAFDIANKFVADLNIVSSCDEVKKCATYIKVLQTNGISNVTETELKILNLLRIELGGDVSQMKEELKRLKDDQSSDRQVIKKQEEMLENLEEDLKSLQNIVNVQGNDQQFRLQSCIPGKNLNLTGRDTEIKQIISSIVENGVGIVSIVGGPGFGKSTIAVEVSHHLSNDHDIVVIFSFLSHALTLSEVRLRLCHDVGVNPGEDPESSLMFWLRSIQKKVVIVMDNIEQLLESDGKSQFVELVLTLRKNSQQHLQILTTTRTEFIISGQTTVNHKILELDEISSVELLRKCCPDAEVENAYLSELAELCGFVPLALCIAGTIIPDLDDPSELIQWLREKPMEALRNSDQCVEQAIEFSFQKLIDEDKKALVCLSVFVGDFQRSSAQEVIERSGLGTQNFLKSLVKRSLGVTEKGHPQCRGNVKNLQPRSGNQPEDKHSGVRDNPIEKAAEARILMKRGNLSKVRANLSFHEDKEKYIEYMNHAEFFYNEALSLANNMLGDHDLTCVIHKLLGDLFLNQRKNEEAMTYYSKAIDMRKKLKLDYHEPFVFLLKNYGACLSFLSRFDESVEKLKEARGIVDKLTEKNTRCKALVYYELARACREWKADCQEAETYAKAALEMQELLDPRDVVTLKEIIKVAEENVAQY